MKTPTYPPLAREKAVGLLKKHLLEGFLGITRSMILLLSGKPERAVMCLWIACYSAYRDLEPYRIPEVDG